MRLRVVLAAFAGILLLAIGTRTSSEGLSTTASTAPIRPVPASVRAADAHAIDQLDQDRAAYFDGVAKAETQRQADEAAAAAEQQRQAERAARATATTVPADPTPVGSGDAEGAVRKYFGDVFDQAWGSDHNYGVTTCESGHDPGAVSPGGGNYGLFQINISHRADFEAYTDKPWSAVFDAYTNAMYARRIYDNAGGWNRDWSCAWAAYR